MFEFDKVEKNPKLEKLEIIASAKSKPAQSTISKWKREQGAADLFMVNHVSKAIFD